MTWFVFALLCLTAYRATRLLIKDTFPPVLWLRDNLVGGWRPTTESPATRCCASSKGGYCHGGGR